MAARRSKPEDWVRFPAKHFSLRLFTAVLILLKGRYDLEQYNFLTKE